MKIYLSHSGNYDYETELYAPLKSSELARTHQIFFPHDEENINVPAKDWILHADLLIAEVSYPSTGQGIELGFANGGGIPILCLYKTGSKISGSLRFVTKEYIEYAGQTDMIEKLQSWLKARE